MKVDFPFPVEEKIIVSDSFLIRDLIYAAYRFFPYRLLVLSEGDSRFFKGYGDQLEEIRNSVFPGHFEDDHEYHHSSLSTTWISSRKRVKDKSKVLENRLKDYLKKIDKAIKNDLPMECPLILVGPLEMVNYFEHETQNRSHLAGKVLGNYDGISRPELFALVRDLLEQYKHYGERKTVSNLVENVGSGKVLWGVKAVWKAVQDKKGKKLLVERNYEIPGYTTSNRSCLVFEPDNESGFKYLPDAVDEMIRLVLVRKGSVNFIQPGKLKEFDRIALFLRY